MIGYAVRVASFEGAKSGGLILAETKHAEEGIPCAGGLWGICQVYEFESGFEGKKLAEEKKMKLLTIAVPCYNSEAYMRKCIESLLVGGEDVEILIVDDGSTKDQDAGDRRRICGEIPDDRPRRSIRRTRGTAARLTLESRTRPGSTYKVVDSDDWVDAEAYKKDFEDAGRHHPGAGDCGCAVQQLRI